MIFSRDYYGSVISVLEIGSHKLVTMAQDIRGKETTCTSSIIMVGTFIKDRYQTPMASLKTVSVCYHLTLSKMTMIESVGASVTLLFLPLDKTRVSLYTKLCFTR